MSAYGVIAFSSTHSAMFAEKLLRDQFSVQMMPTPRMISASCGISLRVLPEELVAIADVLRASDAADYALYLIEHDQVKVVE